MSQLQNVFSRGPEPKKPKNKPKQEYKVHYTDIIDPEKFRNEVIPVIFDAMRALDKIPIDKAV